MSVSLGQLARVGTGIQGSSMTQGGGPQGKSCCESPSHGRSLLVDGWHLVGVGIWAGGLKLMDIRQVGLLGGPSDFWEDHFSRS